MGVYLHGRHLVPGPRGLHVHQGPEPVLPAPRRSDEPPVWEREEVSAFLRVTMDANSLALALRDALSALERSAPAEPGTGERQWREGVQQVAMVALGAHDVLFEHLDLPTSFSPAAISYSMAEEASKNH